MLLDTALASPLRRQFRSHTSASSGWFSMTCHLTGRCTNPQLEVGKPGRARPIAASSVTSGRSLSTRTGFLTGWHLLVRIGTIRSFWNPLLMTPRSAVGPWTPKRSGWTAVMTRRPPGPGSPIAASPTLFIAKKQPRSAKPSPTPKQPMGLRWPVERTNSWLSNFGQLRRNTDRDRTRRLSQFQLAIVSLLTAKLIDWKNRWSRT